MLALSGLSLACLILLAMAGSAPAAEEPLNHYGVATIPDKQVEADFTARFNAQGRPVFLIGDLRRGVAIGDIVRFRNKVVLIDEEVWQTMKSVGVLSNIRNAPVVELSAQATSDVWKSRADLAEGREKIAYTLGAEFITILEDYFGKIPEKAEIGFRFEGSKMTVMAPNELLGVLRFIGKPGGRKPETPNTQPFIVSEAPKRAFEDQPFTWTLWAVDKGSPSTELRYDIDSKLPPGLRWDDRGHAITGKPEKAGTWKIRAKAINPANKTDAMDFDLVVVRNGKPRIAGEPAREMAGDGAWRFQPSISDPDHLLSELKVKPVNMPAGLAFDAGTQTFSLKNGDASQLSQMSFGLEVTDPLGASDKRAFNMAAPTAMRFESALTGSEFLQGQNSFYTPVAQGPGRNIRYEARSETGRVELAGGRIPLRTGSPGSYLMEISAEDELGNRASQMIAYQVKPHEALRQNLRMDARQLSDGANLNLYYRVGRARFGTLFTAVDKATLPFFFAGFEPLPAGMAGKNGVLHLDMGFNFAGTSGVTYGGFMLRLDGRYNRLRDNPFFFKYTAQYYARQGIVLFNPEEFRKNDLGNDKMEACLAELRSGTDQADSLVAGFLKCNEDVDRMMDSYRSGGNEVFLVEMLLGFKLGWSTGIGPVYWLEDHFHSARDIEQRVGAALTHEGSFPWFGYDASLKVGLGKDLPTAKVLLDFSLNFGRPD
jgi:hypothetical protein